MAERIQRSRAKGWRMPAGTIYVGRTALKEGGGWSNPFRIGGYFKIGDNPAYRGPFRMAWMQRCIWEDDDKRLAIAEGYTLIETRSQAVEWYRRYVTQWSTEKI